MSFADAIRTCFRKYFTFSGRASRPEYWWFFLFLILGQIAAGIVDGAVFGTVTTEVERTETSMSARAENSGPVGALFGLATLVPSLSAGWRRMHDTGRSGLYLLYPFIVMIGIGTFAAFSGVTPDNAGWDSADGIAALILIAGLIVFIISPLLVLWWLTRPSQQGSNDYGPNPHEVTP